jgi:hypothetical protein
MKQTGVIRPSHKSLVTMLELYNHGFTQQQPSNGLDTNTAKKI